MPQEFVNEDFFGREKLEAVVPRDSSVLEATLSPLVLMNQVMPSGDRVALTRLDNEALNSKILLNNASTLMGLCEQIRRVDQIMKDKAAVDEALRKSDKENASLRKKLAEAEASMGPRLEAAEAKGKAITGEAVMIAAETAERASAPGVSECVGGFQSVDLANFSNTCCIGAFGIGSNNQRRTSGLWERNPLVCCRRVFHYGP
ncbi:unnamed protein product [Cuscuta europaea]|uniref:Uncharacterized protein n=1 Tax=Cuscuta europaea TaxID=41803 RepID=A0A9P1E6T5_CUSEU|nr:unnamed protein product [Cuscuta europaea]